MPTYGSVNISKGYYNNGTDTIISSGTQASLSELKTGQTIGCKNTLFMTSASGTIAPYISSNNAPTGTFDVYAALNTPIYLNWTKEYIAGGALIEPVWSFSNGGYIANYTVNGSPTISSQYVASGFSGSNYVTSDSSIDLSSASTWEIVTKVTVGSTSEHQKILYGSGVNFGIHRDYGMLRAWLSSNSGSSWFIDTDITSGSSADNKYLKIEFTGSAYNFYSSDDGSSWTLLKTVSSSTKVGAASVMNIGNQGGEYWRGSIDLKETYIKADGAIIWEAVTLSQTSVTTQKALVYDNTNDKTYWYPSETSAQLSNFIAKADKNDLFLTNKTGQPTSDIVVSGNGTTYVKNFTEVGTPTVSNDFAVSGFAAGAIGTGKCVKTSVTLDPSLPWELNCKFTTGAINTSANNTVVGREGNYVSPSIYVSGTNRRLVLMLSVNGTSYFYTTSNDNVIADDTTYWARAEFTGTAYNLYLSTDGVSFTLLNSTSSNKVMNVSTPMTLCFGGRYNNDLTNIVEPLRNSTIYMKDCNIKSNGTVIWTGAEGYIADSSMKDEKSVWLNHAHDKIIGIGTEPDVVELEVSSNNDEVIASQDHYWTYLGNTSYDEQGQSMAASSMSGSLGSGYMMLNPNGTLAFTDATSAYQYVGGNVFSGYSIRFTDNAHTAISNLSNQYSTKCRVYARLSGSSFYAIYTGANPPTGDLKASANNQDGKLDIAPSGTIQEDSYTYDATNDTISIEGSVYSYIGDYYAII